MFPPLPLPLIHTAPPHRNTLESVPTPVALLPNRDLRPPAEQHTLDSSRGRRPSKQLGASVTAAGATVPSADPGSPHSGQVSQR